MNKTLHGQDIKPGIPVAGSVVTSVRRCGGMVYAHLANGITRGYPVSW